jgi:hypothetical protein
MEGAGSGQAHSRRRVLSRWSFSLKGPESQPYRFSSTSERVSCRALNVASDFARHCVRKQEIEVQRRQPTEGKQRRTIQLKAFLVEDIGVDGNRIDMSAGK